MSKRPAKLVSSKSLSGLHGVADVALGVAKPENRMSRDFSKDGVTTQPASQEYDDDRERHARWSRALL